MLSKSEQAEFDKIDFTSLLTADLGAGKYQDLIILHCLKRGDKPTAIASAMGTTIAYVGQIKRKFLNYGIEAITSDLVAKQKEEQRRDVFIDKLLTEQHRAIEKGDFELMLKEVISLRSLIYGEPEVKSLNKQMMRNEGYVRILLPIEDYERYRQWQTNHG